MAKISTAVSSCVIHVTHLAILVDMYGDTDGVVLYKFNKLLLKLIFTLLIIIAIKHVLMTFNPILSPNQLNKT